MKPSDDPLIAAREKERDLLELTGMAGDERDPDYEFTLTDEQLERRDREAEKAGRSWGHLAYRDRPSDRERRELYDENRVRNLIHPRTGQVQVGPLDAFDNPDLAA